MSKFGCVELSLYQNKQTTNIQCISCYDLQLHSQQTSYLTRTKANDTKLQHSPFIKIFTLSIPKWRMTQFRILLTHISITALAAWLFYWSGWYCLTALLECNVSWARLKSFSLFKGLPIHIIFVPPGHKQLAVTKIPSKNLHVLVKLNTVHSVSILLHVHNELWMVYSQTLKV